MGRSEHARSHKGAHAASRTLQLGIEEENRNALVSMCERSNRADHIKKVTRFIYLLLKRSIEQLRCRAL